MLTKNLCGQLDHVCIRYISIYKKVSASEYNQVSSIYQCRYLCELVHIVTETTLCTYLALYTSILLLSSTYEVVDTTVGNKILKKSAKIQYTYQRTFYFGQIFCIGKMIFEVFGTLFTFLVLLQKPCKSSPSSCNSVPNTSKIILPNGFRYDQK